MDGRPATGGRVGVAVPIVYLLFFLSGFAALVFEILWSRRFVTVFARGLSQAEFQSIVATFQSVFPHASAWVSADLRPYDLGEPLGLLVSFLAGEEKLASWARAVPLYRRPALDLLRHQAVEDRALRSALHGVIAAKTRFPPEKRRPGAAGAARTHGSSAPARVADQSGGGADGDRQAAGAEDGRTAARRTGRVAEAIDHLQKGLEIQPENEHARRVLAALLAEGNRPLP